MVEQNSAVLGLCDEGNRLDRMIAGFLQSRLAEVSVGRLKLTLPSGRCVTLGSGDEIDAALHLKSYALVWRSMRRGTIGFADSYMNDEVETPDLRAVMEFFLANFAQFDQAGGGWFKTRLFDRLGHRQRANTKAGSRRNIAAHYDLGNEFYESWLDEGMTYSSGLFKTGGETLAESQDAKHRLVLDALGVEPKSRVLEIGCGWGSVAELLARSGADVTGITVSAEQFEYAKNRLAAAGLSQRADIRFQDYRDVEGEFDRIVSVEMIEAVGAEHWPQYFGVLRDRLVPGGVAVVQGITIREESFESYSRNPDFIQRYIFPGGMLPTVSIMETQAKANGLTFEIVERFGKSYAETLRLWRRNFLAAWPEIKALGFDERFRKMWLYYLAYCEVGFEDGLIDVGVYRFKRES